MINTINYGEISQEAKSRIESGSVEYSGHKEAVGVVMQERIQQQYPTYQPRPVTVSAPSTQSVSADDLPSYAKDIPAPVRTAVEELVHIAFEKGIAEGVHKALSYQDPFIIDMFHDALTEKLVAEMKSKNLI